MKYLFLIFCISNLFFTNLQAEEVATKNDIKIVLEQMDKRFEQVDRRFEQVDRRMDFMQNILYIVLGASISAPFIAEYLARRRDLEIKEEHDKLTKIIFVLKNLAKDDPKRGA